MAASTKAALTLMAVVCAAWAQPVLTLEQASERTPEEYIPARMGQVATVKGVVTAPPVQILGQYWHTGIQEGGYSLVLDSPGEDPRIASLQPGQQVEATGKIGMRSGLLVLQVRQVRVTGTGPAPEPVFVPVRELQDFRHIGKLVTTEGEVLEAGENSGGSFLRVGDRKNSYRVFVPLSPGASRAPLSGLAVGDRVRATGLGSQYCPYPPFNRSFQLTVGHAEQVVRLERRWLVDPALMLGSIFVALLFGFTLWGRERRMKAQRETLRRAYQLGEEILGSASVEEIQAKVAAVLPQIFEVSGAHLYVHNLGAKALDEVTAKPEGPGISVPLNETAAGLQAAAAACFQNRALLVIPDTYRSPFPGDHGADASVRAALFVPMLAQGEAVGVLRVDERERVREFSADEQTLAQHLANQIGVALRLLDQRMVREQLFRTEKLAAVGKLISGVVNELRAPLASICQRAEAVACDPRTPSEQREREAQAIFAEARQAAQIVSRLVAFASTEPVEAKPVELNALIASLMEFREREWASRGIRGRAVPAEGHLPVVGSQGQLEQVVLDLLVYIEQALAEAAEKSILLRTFHLGRKALIEISYTAARGGPDPFAAADGTSNLGVGVCRSIIAGHGGELRAVISANADPRFEIELPLAGRERAPAAPTEEAQAAVPMQSLTVLVIESDETAQRQLVTMLGARGCRVVPVQNSDVGLEMALCVRFDATFCSFHAPGLNWVELSEQLQHRGGAFVLVTDAYDAELAADFEGDGRFVLPKPIEEAQLDRLLARVGKLGSVSLPPR